LLVPIKNQQGSLRMTHIKVSPLFLKTFIFLQFFVISPFVNASLILNGNFDTDLSHWHDASDNGSVVFDNGVANLSTGNDFGPYSAVLVQGDEGFFKFNSPILIDTQQSLFEFDLWQIAHSIDGSESGTSSLTDALNLSIYDAFDPSFDMFFIDFVVTSQQKNFSLDISSLAGRFVAFSFELNDENDGFDSTFSLDNVRLTSPVNVPEPSTLLLFSIAVFALTRRKLTKI
jgi:hypothetical protein